MTFFDITCTKIDPNEPDPHGAPAPDLEIHERDGELLALLFSEQSAKTIGLDYHQGIDRSPWLIPVTERLLQQVVEDEFTIRADRPLLDPVQAFAIDECDPALSLITHLPRRRPQRRLRARRGDDHRGDQAAGCHAEGGGLR
jgi:hypothetical protein